MILADQARRPTKNPSAAIGKSIPAPYRSRLSVCLKEGTHEVDRQDDDRHPDEIDFQLLRTVDLQPCWEGNLVDEELVENHRGDVQHCANQESVTMFHDLKDDHPMLRSAGFIADTKRSEEQFGQ